MPETIERLHQLITDRLHEIEGETGKLEGALAEMGEGSRQAPAGPKAQRRPRAGKRRARAKRGQRREQLLAAIKAKPGAGPSELAAEIGISPAQVSTLQVRSAGGTAAWVPSAKLASALYSNLPLAQRNVATLRRSPFRRYSRLRLSDSRSTRP